MSTTRYLLPVKAGIDHQNECFYWFWKSINIFGAEVKHTKLWKECRLVAPVNQLSLVSGYTVCRAGYRGRQPLQSRGGQASGGLARGSR